MRSIRVQLPKVLRLHHKGDKETRVVRRTSTILGLCRLRFITKNKKGKEVSVSMIFKPNRRQRNANENDDDGTLKPLGDACPVE